MERDRGGEARGPVWTAFDDLRPQFHLGRSITTGQAFVVVPLRDVEPGLLSRVPSLITLAMRRHEPFGMVFLAPPQTEYRIDGPVERVKAVDHFLHFLPDENRIDIVPSRNHAAAQQLAPIDNRLPADIIVTESCVLVLPQTIASPGLDYADPNLNEHLQSYYDYAALVDMGIDIPWKKPRLRRLQARLGKLLRGHWR